MRIGFPSPIQEFDVMRAVPRDQPTQYAHIIGHPLGGLIFQPPIDLKPGDHVWIDLRTSDVHIVERGGIAIWRSGWQN